MAILRSRTIDSNPTTVPNPGVERSIKQWEDKVAAAKQSGIAEAEQTLATQRQALEQDKQNLQQQIDAGVAQAQQQLEQSLGVALQALQHAVDRIELIEKEMVKSSEHEIVRLASVLAGRVLRREIHLNDQWVNELLRDVLQQVPERNSVTLRMNPEDLAAIGNYIDDIAKQSGIRALHIEEDLRLVRGSLLIQSGGTELDASVSTNWKRMSDRILGKAPPADFEIIAEDANHD